MLTAAAQPNRTYKALSCGCRTNYNQEHCLKTEYGMKQSLCCRPQNWSRGGGLAASLRPRPCSMSLIESFQNSGAQAWKVRCLSVYNEKLLELILHVNGYTFAQQICLDYICKYYKALVVEFKVSFFILYNCIYYLQIG